MPRISNLSSLTTPDNSDELAIVDTSASVTKKITRGDLFKAPLPTNSVTTAAIADGAVTASKIDWPTLRLGKSSIATSVTSTAAITTPSEITGLAVTFTLTETRTVRATFFASSWHNSGANYNRLYITNGSVSLANQIGMVASSFTTANQEYPVNLIAEKQLTAGTYTFRVGLGRNSGTATITSTADYPVWMAVDVVG